MAANTSDDSVIKLPILEENIDDKVVTHKTAQLPITSTPKPEPKPEPERRNITIIKLITLSLTMLSFVLSLMILFVFIWLLYVGSYDCEALLNLSKLQGGIIAVLIIVFVVNNVVVYLRSKLYVTIGLVLVTVPLIVMLVIGLGLVGSFNAEARMVHGSSRWIKMKVYNNHNWDDIKACLYDTRVCNGLPVPSYIFNSYDFPRKLSHTESGCCLPPSSCGMEYVNATYWKKGDKSRDSSSTSYDQDCDLWKNNETSLCYNCQACKDGFINPIEYKWRKLGVFLIVMSVLLILAHLILFVLGMFQNSRG